MIVIVGDKSNEGFLLDIVEAKLNDLCPTEKIVRLRQVDAKDVYTASYMIERVAYYLPKHTIFLSAIDGLNDSARIPIVLETKDEKIFVGFDNGAFTAVAENFGIHQIRRIESAGGFSLSFLKSAMNILVPAVSKIASGTDVSELGDLYMTYYSLKYHRVNAFPEKIEGEIAFFDGGNVETNIPFSLIKKIGIEFGDEVVVKGKRVLVSEDERDKENKELVLREGIGGYAEIISKHSAARLLKAELGEKLTLEVLK
ncbi:SAM-dependent chlorinase/fluorinase [Mesoaciditoga lauensis]|uniref:SAM-dependent chlorinase/fluorinase n=1 Tax=Mesoaciditoga lauensis TaxID=1495039 RepID=UPI00055C3003|nr:SAM-dependent chlorinase/fluorinase [Mesoaciditoga lauensis]